MHPGEGVGVVPDIEWNREVWDQTHDWSEEGDEWSGMAAHCGQPYEAWKKALVDQLLMPRVADKDVLEIAPGHGRFTTFIVPAAKSTTLVDLSQTCLDACHELFGDDESVTYVLTDGTTLPGVPDASIDFVWSFDSFVHMEIPVIDAYLGEIARVLRPGGGFVLHHAAKRDWALKLAPAAHKLGSVGRVGLRMAGQGRLRDSGRRADVSAEAVGRLLKKNNLELVSQVDSWGDSGQYDVTKYHDTITTGRKP
jgi:SAM-dependent methyltransferase